jgi:hypothetical protein
MYLQISTLSGHKLQLRKVEISLDVIRSLVSSLTSTKLCHFFQTFLQIRQILSPIPYETDA